MKQKSLKAIVWQSCVALLLSLSMMLSLLCSVQAEEMPNSGSCGDNVFWSLADGTITISGNGGMPASYEYDEAPWNEWNDEIIHVVVEKGVVAIADFAFEDCVNLQTVTLSATVEHIGWSSFLSCTSLQEFVVDEANNTFCAIDGNLIQRKTASFYRYAPGKTETAFEIPQGIVHINGSAFYKCENLEMVTIPTSVTSIGTLAFMRSKNLKKVSFSYSVELIDRLAFYACNSLQSVEFIGNAEIWAHIDVRAHNENLLNAERTYIRPKRPGYEFAEVTVEVRDAETKELIPDTSLHIYQKVFGSRSETTFVDDCDGKTKHNIEFPIDDVYVYTSGLYEYTSFENVKKPANGKLVFYAQPKEIYVDTEGITLYGRTEMMIGETQKIVAWVYPITADDKYVIWSSSNWHVASVDMNGKVTANGAGTATITAKTWDGGFEDTVTIHVTNEVRLASFYDVAYRFSNTAVCNSGILLKTYQYVFGEEKGIIEFQNDKAKGRGGVCSGMVATSMMFYNGYRNYIDYGGNNIRQLRAHYDKVKNFIHYMYLANNEWFCSACKKNAIANNWDDEGFIHNNVYNMTQLVKNARIEILSVYVCNEKNAHELLSYGITENSKDKNGKSCSRLWIYDCNEPDKSDLYIALYKNDDGTYSGEWSYNGDYSVYREKSILSFVTYEDILYCAQQSSNIQLMSLTESAAQKKNITFFQNSYNSTLLNGNAEKVIILDGIVQNNGIEGAVHNKDYFTDDEMMRLTLPDDTYTVSGYGETEQITTTAYSSSDSISTVTANSAEITFDIRDVATETVEADNFVNINNKSVSADYAITYMPFASVYGYDYDTITVSGNTDGVVSTYEKGGNLYVSGDDAIRVSVVVGNETVVAEAEKLDTGSVYCIKFETTDEGASIQILCEETEVSEKVQLPDRQKAPLPTYDLESGEYTEGQLLTLTPANEMVNLYYTIDGSEPEEDISMLYSSPISVDKTMHIKVLATQYGCENSEILELTYTLPETAQPFASVSSGTYDTNQLVELFAEDDAEIYYTMEGTEPTETGILYNTPITVYEDVTIKAYAKKNGVVSETVTYQYEINHRSPLFISNGAINQDGEMLKNDNMEELSKVTLVVNKTTEEDVTGTVVAAFYDGNKKLLNMFSLDCTLTENENVVELPVEAVAGAKNAKFFIWNKADSGKPICEYLEMN